MGTVTNIDRYLIDGIINEQTETRKRALLIIKEKYEMDIRWWKKIREERYGLASAALIAKHKGTEPGILAEMLWAG